MSSPGIKQLSMAALLGLVWFGIFVSEARPVAYTYSNAVLSDSPVGYWRLDETHGAGAGPQSIANSGSETATNSQDGYYNFADTTGSDIGAVGPRPAAFNGFQSTNRAAHFDGTNDHIYIINQDGYDITGELTVEAWINPDTLSIAAPGTILGQYGPHYNARSHQFEVLNTTGKLRFIVSENGTSETILDSTGAVTAGQWTHVAATFKPNDFMRLYINGSKVGELTEAADDVPSAIFKSDQAFRMGYYRDPGVNKHLFDGLMDEPAVYSQALGAGRVAEHFLSAVRIPGTPRMLHYKLDETTGITATDSGVNGNTGTLTGGETFATVSVTGKFGNAAQFDGNDYISVSNIGGLPGTGDDFTVTTWLNVDDWDQRGMIASYNLNSIAWNIGMYDASSGQLHFGTEFGTNDDALIETGSLPTSEFVHLAVVFTASGDIGDIFINGDPVAEAGNNHWYFGDPGFFTLGNRIRNGSESIFFDGAMDDFAIFDRVLTQAQIHAVMNFGADALYIPEPSTLMLLSLGGLGLAACARRRRK